MSSPRGEQPEGNGEGRRTVLRTLRVCGFVATAAVVAGLGVRTQTRWGAEQAALFRHLDLAVLAFFLIDAVLRAALAERTLRHLREHKLDLTVVLALLQAVAGTRWAWAWFLARQTVAYAVGPRESGRYRRLVSQLRLHPARLMVGSFAGAILVGTVLLSLPMATPGAERLGVVDSLFTATSATCVTGLIVKDTGSDFTLFGQLVILVLIQLGGLGIMTFSVSLVLAFGRQISKSREVVMQDVLDQDSVHEVVSLVRFIALATLVAEAVGAGALYFCFAPRHGHSLPTLYLAIFHSISAFCNAGFSLFRDSLMGYRGDVWVNVVMMTLIVVGGLGFPVLRNLLVVVSGPRLSVGAVRRLRIQTKVVLATSLALIVLGGAVFYVVERNRRLAGLGTGETVLACTFQSVTTRTAGFNTVDIGQVGGAGLLLMMCLMFIGASPGSTGGGVKTTTFAILLQTMRASLRRRPKVELFQRTVPTVVVRRAVALVVLSALLCLVGATALMTVESQPFESVAFEAISAFGTVGLSAGATTHLTTAGRLIITVLMFVGRLGPLTMALSLVGEARPAAYGYPEEHMMVG